MNLSKANRRMDLGKQFCKWDLSKQFGKMDFGTQFANGLRQPKGRGTTLVVPIEFSKRLRFSA
jgi:hypothetical protein